MRRSIVRALLVWLLVTAAVVVGASRTFDEVRDDVTPRRPAPMSPAEVGRTLRERTRAGAPSVTVAPEAPTGRQGEPGAPDDRGGPATTPTTGPNPSTGGGGAPGAGTGTTESNGSGVPATPSTTGPREAGSGDRP